MKFALRRASTLVAASAILGCTTDGPASPRWGDAAIVMPAPVDPIAVVPTAVVPTAVVPTTVVPATVVPTVVAAAPPPAEAVPENADRAGAFPADSDPAPLTRTTVGTTVGTTARPTGAQPPIDDPESAASGSPDAPAGYPSIGTARYAREQSLGFQNSASTSSCLNEGDALGSWRLRFSGYGCVGLTTDATGTALKMQPMIATANEETHAPLLLGPEYGDRMLMTARFETVQQLRKNGEPNAWEVAWLLWQYQDDQHFYYFIAKPNGWEVGKRDPAYPGGQRFLATGTAQKFPVGRAVNVQISHRGNTFSVTVDGVLLTTFADVERPYVSGRVALYSEDAEVRVHQVNVRSGTF